MSQIPVRRYHSSTKHSHLWLTGAFESGDDRVEIGDHPETLLESQSGIKADEWIVRSTSGTGDRSYTYINPAEGESVHALETIFLQRNYKEARCFSGGRSMGGIMAVIQNTFESDYETTDAFISMDCANDIGNRYVQK